MTEAPVSSLMGLLVAQHIKPYTFIPSDPTTYILVILYTAIYVSWKSPVKLRRSLSVGLIPFR